MRDISTKKTISHTSNSFGSTVGGFSALQLNNFFGAFNLNFFNQNLITTGTSTILEILSSGVHRVNGVICPHGVSIPNVNNTP